MDRRHFGAALKDIERGKGGGGYLVNLTLSNGSQHFEVAISYVHDTEGLIRCERPDYPPTYVAMLDVVTIQEA